MNDFTQIIDSEEQKLITDLEPAQRLGILYNLFELKKRAGINRDNYINFKNFINCYIEVVKKCDYGYDHLNQNKIEEVIGYLETDEKVSGLRYAISIMAKELPEYDRRWLIEIINKAEIKQIVHRKQYKLYLKALVLFLSNRLQRLIVVLICFFIIIYIALLPAISPQFIMFQISYDKYSNNFWLNHFLNVLTLFADFDNNFKIYPLNGLAVIISVAAKIFFVLLIINFLYRKITDKIKVQ